MQHLFTGGVVLPDHPVSKGDSWTSKSSTPVPLPNGQTAQMQTTLTSTLKSVVAQGAHTIATIDTNGTVAMPGQRTFNETFTSGTRFDVTSGVTLGSTLQMQVAMDLAAQTSGAPNPPAGGFPAATMHGTIKITTGPVPRSVGTRPGAGSSDRAPARRPIRRR
jgi:hypothetical protein